MSQTNISVEADGRITIDRNCIVLPTTADGVAEAIGRPDRKEFGKTPAPVGHSSPEILIYDRLGFYFIKNHRSREIMNMTVVFGDGGLLPSLFKPAEKFSGILDLCGFKIAPSLPSIAEAGLENRLKILPGGMCVIEVGRFVVSIEVDRKPRSSTSSVLGKVISVSVDA